MTDRGFPFVNLFIVRSDPSVKSREICHDGRGSDGRKAAEPNMDLVFINCAHGMYGDLDDYARAVEASMNNIIHQTGQQGGNWYNKAPEGTAVCYGHGRCAMDITVQDCSGCLEGVCNYMIQRCKNSRGVHCKVVSCEFRYEEYAFDDG
ncbi:hypothetical protein MLD38_030112 [Melastoma candidum]|uniref:Uncharacterized protein n=1 Tax=Melastoma candidum TaxID=119954 RepID=A0ACB9MKB6_9MYRT|nr:hypothetical protein MLD38_030112 [Melastoma candidum]